MNTSRKLLQAPKEEEDDTPLYDNPRFRELMKENYHLRKQLGILRKQINGSTDDFTIRK